jgi:hypothetical protein
VSDLLSYYSKQNLRRVVVLSHEHEIRMSGVEYENTYETIVAARAKGFVKMSVHLLTEFVPSRKRFSVLSEEEITETQYNEFATASLEGKP